MATPARLSRSCHRSISPAVAAKQRCPSPAHAVRRHGQARVRRGRLLRGRWAEEQHDALSGAVAGAEKDVPPLDRRDPLEAEDVGIERRRLLQVLGIERAFQNPHVASIGHPGSTLCHGILGVERRLEPRRNRSARSWFPDSRRTPGNRAMALDETKTETKTATLHRMVMPGPPLPLRPEVQGPARAAGLCRRRPPSDDARGDGGVQA